MGISFRLSPLARRFHSPPPASAAVDEAPPPPPPAPTASPDDGSSPPPRLPPPPWDAAAAAAARVDGGVAARSGLSDRNGNDHVDLDLEPSFTLNLFPDGYSIGEPSKGALLFLIADDPEKQPYNKASTSLLSDIEYGRLPQDISHDTPCKFLNGNVVCEVRDYRSFLSNGGDSSRDDFPKVNRVALRLGTECVVKDLSSILDSSCTYHDQLIAESLILNSLQPKLNLDPTPCLERLYNSVAKKIDLGLNKGRQHTKDASALNISTDPPEKYKPKDCDACEGAAVCIENAALVALPSGIVNSSSVHCPSSLHINSANSSVGSDPHNTTRCSSTIRSSSTLSDRKQNASSTPAPDNLLESYEQRAHAASFHDCKNGESPRDTFLSQKRKEPLNPPCMSDERQNNRASNKNARLSSQSSKSQSQNSMETSHKEGIKMVSSKELPVEVMVDQNKDIRIQQQKPLSMFPTIVLHPFLNKNNPCAEKDPEKGKLVSPKKLLAEIMADQTVGNKDIRVHQVKAPSLLPTNHPHLALSRNKPCVEKIPEAASSSHTGNKEGHLASILDMGDYCTAELKDSRTSSVTSCNESSRNAAWIATEVQPTTSKKLASGNSTVSLKHKINLKGKRQNKTDIQMKQPCENRSSEESGATDGTSSHLGISSDAELCVGHPLYTTEPDIENNLSDVIMTAQRHGLNGNAVKIDGPETSRPLPSCSLPQFFSPGSAEGSPYMWEEVISYYPAGRTNYRIIRRLIFHRVRYFCRGIIDQSHYILCLLESDAPDDHQIVVEAIIGDEHVHIATLPTCYHASKFVDQFICLMKQDGYTLCNAAICNEPSDLRQQFEYFSQFGYPAGEYPQHEMFSPCVAKSIVIKERKDTGCAFQRRLPKVHANVLQQGNQQWVLTGPSPAFGSAEAFHFLNPPRYSAEQQYNSRVLQDQGLPLACGVCSVDIDQYLSVQPSQEVSMDLSFQRRHDMPCFSEGCARNTCSYDQRWHQVPTQLDSSMCQVDNFPAFGGQPAGRGMPLHLFLGTQASSQSQFTGLDDGSVRGAPLHLPVHLDSQYLS